METIEPLGDRALIAWFASEREAARWSAAVRAQGWPGIVDVVTAYRSVAVFADPERIDLDRFGEQLRALPIGDEERAAGRVIELPVCYDGEDLADVAERLGVSAKEVIARHSGQDYDVFAIGFLPGFPYAGYLPDALSGLPRREPPRVQVPTGSVAIAGRQTGVYPRESPGGWHLLGRTPLRIVDVAQGHFPIRAGDRLRFVPIGPDEFERLRGELLP